MSDEVAVDVLGLTERTVAAHVSRNQTSAGALPALIESVYGALTTVGLTASHPEAQIPAVPIRKSVFPDFIICLEGGRRMKMLKRHLHEKYGMTPGEYRTKWGLPSGYPMVAPSYASHRSSLAEKSGLGRKPTAEPAVSRLPARRAKGSRG